MLRFITPPHLIKLSTPTSATPATSASALIPSVNTDESAAHFNSEDSLKGSAIQGPESSTAIAALIGNAEEMKELSEIDQMIGQIKSELAVVRTEEQSNTTKIEALEGLLNAAKELKDTLNELDQLTADAKPSDSKKKSSFPEVYERLDERLGAVQSVYGATFYLKDSLTLIERMFSVIGNSFVNMPDSIKARPNSSESAEEPSLIESEEILVKFLRETTKDEKIHAALACVLRALAMQQTPDISATHTASSKSNTAQSAVDTNPASAESDIFSSRNQKKDVGVQTEKTRVEVSRAPRRKKPFIDYDADSDSSV